MNRKLRKKNTNSKGNSRLKTEKPLKKSGLHRISSNYFSVKMKQAFERDLIEF